MKREIKIKNVSYLKHLFRLNISVEKFVKYVVTLKAQSSTPYNG